MVIMSFRNHVIQILSAVLTVIAMLFVGTATANAYSFADGYVHKEQSCIYARNPRTVKFVEHEATGSDSGGHLVTRRAFRAYSSTNGTVCSTVSGLYGIKTGTGTFTYFSGDVRKYQA